MALQECVLLPAELARLANGYIDARRPFTLAKDPAKAGELGVVMWRSIQAIHRVLVGLLPVLPHQAAEGLRQMGVEVDGKSLAELMRPLAPGHKLGQGQVLFPPVE